MTPSRLEDLLARFPSRRIAVLGDFFLDKYLDVDPTLAETSLETGKRAHQVVAIRKCPGAAGTVVSNLSALGAGTLHAIGFSGDDGEGYDLRAGLSALRCDTQYLFCVPERFTPTYLKPRDVTEPSLAGEHERYDTKNRQPTPAATIDMVLAAVERLLPDIDALIVLDQVEEEECGVITARVRDALAEQALRHSRVVFWADSRRRIRCFRNLIIKPNQFEAAGIENPRAGDEIDWLTLQAAVQQLRDLVGAPICVTRGPQGMVVSDPSPQVVPGVRVEGPVDPTGAGDSATAGAVLALTSGATLAEAALVGNLVASITVQQLAVTGTATPEQVRARLSVWREQQAC